MKLKWVLFIRIFLFLGPILGAGVFPQQAFPQASVNVSVSDPVYRDIDKLVAHGLVDKIIVGQKPFSRREIARITAEAIGHLPRLEDKLKDSTTSEGDKKSIQARLDFLQPILDRLKNDYREELIQLGALEGETGWYSLHPVEKVEVETLLTNSKPEALPVSNGLGNINAVINPLVDNRQGRHLVEGYNLSLESSHWARVTPYLAFFVRPRFQLGITPQGQPNDNNVYVQNLYGKLWVKNFEIEVGRDNLFHGQGQEAELLLSQNPRGLDMVKISNDSPFILPWVFKYLGANKISFYYSDLGPAQNFPHAYLVGYQWNIEPLSFFELGFNLSTQGGGQGSPPASLGQRITDILPFSGQSFNFQISNKMAELELRFRIPPARGLEIYTELGFDDVYLVQSFGLNLKQDTGYLAGLYAPRLTNTGNVDLRLEYHRTGMRYYEHGQFVSGWTLNQLIMGDNLGPNSQGFYLTSNWDIDSRNQLTFQGAFESRSHDIFTNVEPGFHFVVIQDNPSENRYRGTVQWLHRFKTWPMFIRGDLGYERVQNFGFVSGVGRNNFLGDVSLQINFDRWTKRPR